MESWGFLRDGSNISSLENQAFEMALGEAEGHGSGRGSAVFGNNLVMIRSR